MRLKTVASRRLNWRSGQAVSLPSLSLPSFRFPLSLPFLIFPSSPLPLALRSRPLGLGECLSFPSGVLGRASAEILAYLEHRKSIWWQGFRFFLFFFWMNVVFTPQISTCGLKVGQRSDLAQWTWCHWLKSQRSNSSGRHELGTLSTLLSLVTVTFQTTTYIYFHSEDLALLLQTWWTVGRYQTLGDGREELMSFTGHVPSGLDDLTARSPQIRTRNHLWQRLGAFLQLCLWYRYKKCRK